MADDQDDAKNDLPKSSKAARIGRGAVQALGGAIPFAGGLFSLVASNWSEKEQERINEFFRAWIQMQQDEIQEQEATIIEMMARLDVTDEKINERLASRPYQGLLKKTFREWAAAESEEKRVLIRNILSNAAASDMSSDDVVRMFLDWINDYSEMHFQVISVIYNQSRGISRGEMWRRINREPVREDSADADVFKLLIRDLSTGGVIRQYRETDYDGNFIQKQQPKGHRSRGGGTKTMKSAFDENDLYVLTDLGQQFVHYSMTDLPVRIDYDDPLDD